MSYKSGFVSIVGRPNVGKSIKSYFKDKISYYITYCPDDKKYSSGCLYR